MIYEKLRSIRKQKGISQEKMAKILFTDTSNYSRKERGETKIYNDEWEKIAETLEVPVEEIKESSKNLIRKRIQLLMIIQVIITNTIHILII